MSEPTTTVRIGVLRERGPGERRVALVPDGISRLKPPEYEVLVESGAGIAAGHPDEEYTAKGAKVVEGLDAVLEASDVLLTIRLPSSDSEDDALIRNGLGPEKTLIGIADALSDTGGVERMAKTGARTFALEMVPRISRAQSMDVLSSMATIAGYKAVLIAANDLPAMFPMSITAAGTLKPARVLVIGAGVAGLQAIATANRLGARVEGYDIRSAVKEQIESVGGSFVELDLETGDSEDAGGYAREKDEAFYDRQRHELGKVVSRSNVVITTAAIPGRPSPRLITREAVEGMAPGSVIIDLASERGGNCELTRHGEIVEHQGVRIHGPSNLPATVPTHSSQMFSRNLTNLLGLLVDGGELKVDPSDPIVEGTLLTEGGEVHHARVREIMGLEPLASQSPQPENTSPQPEDTSPQPENTETESEGDTSGGDESAVGGAA